MKKYLLHIVLIFIINFAFSQEKKSLEGVNVLVLLDASFSMKEKWNSRTKFEIASEAMVKMIEEEFLENSGKRFAFRLFGNRSGMNLKDCNDTELIVDFDQRNIENIKERLDQCNPKGWSPISLAIMESIDDFRGMEDEFNTLIFITDGGETCDGQPCAAAEKLQESGILAIPFVIGLGDSDFLIEDVGCIGNYSQASTEEKFIEELTKVFNKIDLRTTAQVYFKNHDGDITETDIPFSINRPFSQRSDINFVHALSEKKLSDTVILSSLGSYEMIIHTTPEMVKEGVKLSENKHNVFSYDAARGKIDLELKGERGFADFECIIRDWESKEIISVQEFPGTASYLEGLYDLELTTFPRQYIDKIEVKENQTYTLAIERSGNILIKNDSPLIGSVYSIRDKDWIKARELYEISGSNSYSLQPGEYMLIYNYEKDPPTETKQLEFTIISGRVTTLNL